MGYEICLSIAKKKKKKKDAFPMWKGIEKKANQIPRPSYSGEKKSRSVIKIQRDTMRQASIHASMLCDDTGACHPPWSRPKPAPKIQTPLSPHAFHILHCPPRHHTTSKPRRNPPVRTIERARPRPFTQPRRRRTGASLIAHVREVASSSREE